MLSDLTPTDVAFVMAGLTQAVAAVLWLIGGWVTGDTQRAAGHWSAFAALGAASFAFLVAAMLAHDAPRAEALRAVGNLAGIAFGAS